MRCTAAGAARDSTSRFEAEPLRRYPRCRSLLFTDDSAIAPGPHSAAPRSAWLRVPDGAGWWRFSALRGEWVAWREEEVLPLLAAVEEEAERHGLWAVGYVAYEAAPAFDRALVVRPGRTGPLAAFGLFGPPEAVAQLPPPAGPGPWVADLTPALAAAEHAAALAEIRSAIARGETYQVNFTFPLGGRLLTPPEELFFALAPGAEAPYAAFLDLGERAVVSLSPELFFARDGERLRMRPMKGTRRRGRWGEEDARLAGELAAAEKDRAENLMIVDMVRNDLGRAAVPGTVRVASLFDVERYPTVWQMTSSVEAESTARLPEIFAALFPCASVTGAPKASTMGWIARLEVAPRGVYCGAIGWVAPGGRASFAVAIRTALAERASGKLVYGVGSGVVWDSDPTAEHAECLAKGAALAADPRPFVLIETLRGSPERGCRRLAGHLDRLGASASLLGFRCDRTAVAAAIARHVAAWPAGSGLRRVRLTLDRAGEVEVTSEPFERERRPWTVAVAPEPVDSGDLFLCHKTSRRAVYERALAAARARGADEAILWNERGELTEATRSNLLVRLDGRWLTPARECGLLAGVARERLLRSGRVTEAILPREALARVEAVLLVNALRGPVRVARVVGSSPEGDRLMWSQPEIPPPAREER